jgi:hypothetical protein
VSTLIDAAASIAAAITAAGPARATMDPRLLERPGILLAIDSVTTDRPGCRASVAVKVTAVHPGPEALAAAAWLWDTAVPQIAAVCGALTFTPTTWADMSAATATLNLEVYPWP